MNRKEKISPWIFVVLIGVLAILFAVFGMQQQTEAMTVKKEIERIAMQLQVAENRAAQQESLAAQQKRLAMEMVKQVEQRERELIARLEECMKKKKR